MSKNLALVTGATKGLGYRIAKQLEADGYFVIGTYVREYSNEHIKELETDSMKLFRVDASDFEACEAFAKKVNEDYGALQVLVNNAGVVRDNLMLRMSHDDFKQVIDVNLTGVFNMTKVFAKAMLRKKAGSIVNITSVIGEIGNVGQANYAASKAGLIGFSKSIAKEFASRNIRVNCVAPGFIETDMTANLEESLQKEILKNVALQTFGEAQDVANAVSFLVSDKAKYITGQTLNVCGGLVI